MSNKQTFRAVPVIKFQSGLNEDILDSNGNVICNVYEFSNFAFAPLQVKPTDPLVNQLVRVCPQWRDWMMDSDLGFTCTEAIWQSLKSKTRNEFDLFNILGSSIGETTLDRNPNLFEREVNTFRLFYPNDKDGVAAARKNRNYWAPHRMVGTLFQRLVRSDKINERPLLKEPPYNLTKKSFDMTREFLEPNLERDVWCAILKHKFNSHERLKRGLLATGDAYLLEFDRAAARTKHKVDVHWGGFLKVQDDGSVVLLGKNKMGEYLMRVRHEFVNDIVVD